MITKCCSCGRNRIDSDVNFNCNWCMLDYTLNSSIDWQKKEQYKLVWLNKWSSITGKSV